MVAADKVLNTISSIRSNISDLEEMMDDIDFQGNQEAPEALIESLKKSEQLLLDGLNKYDNLIA